MRLKILPMQLMALGLLPIPGAPVVQENISRSGNLALRPAIG